MKKNDLDFKNEKLGRLFRSLFFPTLVAMVFNSLLNVCDGMFVGHGVGPDGLAAINIVAPIFMLTIGIGLMFGFGASVMGSIRLADNNVKGARTVMTQAYVAGSVIFIAIIVLCFVFTDDILRIFGSNDRLLQPARDYLLWLLPGFFFFYIQCAGMMLVRLDGSPRYAMAIQVCVALLNIVLDWLMVFPLGMGIMGASVATSLSCVVGGCMVIAYFQFMSHKLKFCRLGTTAKALSQTVSNAFQMMRIGFATFLQELSIGGMMIAGNFMFLSLLGEDGVAAFSVGCYLFPIMFSISNAVAQSAQPIISFSYGCGAYDRMAQALRLAVRTAVICGLIISVCLWLGAPILSMVFLPAGSHAFAIAVKGLPILGVCAMFFAVNVTLIGYYQSIEHVITSTVYSLLRGLVIVIPAFIFLPKLTGNVGLWLAIPLAEFLTMLVIVARFRAARPQVAK